MTDPIWVETITILLFGLLLTIGILIGRTRSLFAAVMMSGIFSLLSAALFVVMDAVDVAFTEAAVGAGISSVLFLAAMAYLPAEEKPATHNNLAAFMICGIAGLLLVAAAAHLPAIGDPNAPAHMHVAPRYLAESGEVLHIPNVVTTVLASYRGFDTLGETIVVFTAGLGVLLLLTGITRTRKHKSRSKKEG